MIGSHYKKNTAQGFTILFAVIVSVLVLSIGASIISIALKQIIFSSAGRESQFAFYASDSGVECALYWDFQGQNVFATSSSSVTPSNPSTIVCGEGSIVQKAGATFQWNGFITGSTYNWTTAKTSNAATTTFRMVMNVDDNQYYCSDVLVAKWQANGRTNTRIDSRGYNSCDPTTYRRYERGLRVAY